MKVIGDFNKISNELKKTIPKLKQGQVVTFQMLNGVTNPEPDQAERMKTPMLYPKTQIPTNDRIFDPYLNDGTGDYVDIGVPKTYSKDTFGNLLVEPKLFVPGLGHLIFGGKFELVGGKVDDDEMFEYLWICNSNGKNPNRDTSVKALFQPINVLEDSKATIQSNDVLFDAISLAKNMDVATATQIAASLNWSAMAEPTVLMAKIRDFATKFPDQFLKTANSPKTKTKALVKQALDNHVITFDMLTKQIRMSDEVIATLTLKDSDDVLNVFADWLNTAKNGNEVKENIEGQLNAKKEEAAELLEQPKKSGRPKKEKEEVVV